jgi:hypothetical protein
MSDEPNAGVMPLWPRRVVAQWIRESGRREEREGNFTQRRKADAEAQSEERGERDFVGRRGVFAVSDGFARR